MKCQLCPACFCLNSRVHQGLLRESIPAAGAAVYVRDAPQLAGVLIASVVYGGCLSGHIFFFCVKILPFFCTTRYSSLTLILPPFLSGLFPSQATCHYYAETKTLNYPWRVQPLTHQKMTFRERNPLGNQERNCLFLSGQHLHNNSYSFISWMFIYADGSWQEIDYVASAVFLDTARVSFHQTGKVSPRSLQPSLEPSSAQTCVYNRPTGLRNLSKYSFSANGVEVGEQTRQIQMQIYQVTPI